MLSKGVGATLEVVIVLRETISPMAEAHFFVSMHAGCSAESPRHEDKYVSTNVGASWYIQYH